MNSIDEIIYESEQNMSISILHASSTYISPPAYDPLVTRIDTTCDTDFAIYYSLFYQGDDSITSHSYT